MERYYSTQRPVAPGTYPKPEHNRIGEIVNFDSKTYCPEIEREAWGYIEYEYPLSDGVVADYELATENTLAGLNSPFERRRAFEYGKEGNKVVRHWHNVQRVIGSIFKSEEGTDEYGSVTFDLFIFFSGCQDGLLLGHYRDP